MRSGARLCLLVLASHALPVTSATAQSVIALTVAERDYERTALTARSRAPSAVLSSPLLAAVASDRLGMGAHLHLGLATDEPYSAVYGASFDVPVSRQARSSRIGFSGAAIEGLCSEGFLSNQEPCILGYAFGMNASGTFARIRPSDPLAVQTFSIAWSLDVSTASLSIPQISGVIGEDPSMKERSASLGIGVPLLLSFRSGRRTSATESDWRFKPFTTLFVEPAVSINQLWGQPNQLAPLPQFTAGASILEIGPGLGVTAVLRKMLTGTRPPTGAVSVSYHRRRVTGPPHLPPGR